jgi:hypothetical protein
MEIQKMQAIQRYHQQEVHRGHEVRYEGGFQTKLDARNDRKQKKTADATPDLEQDFQELLDQAIDHH